MEAKQLDVVHQPWLLMECGRRLYAHVIGLESFTVHANEIETAEPPKNETKH